MKVNPFHSWSLSFVLEHARWMTLGSAIRYRTHQARRFSNYPARPAPSLRDGKPELLHLQLRAPCAGDIWLRTGCSDDTTFDEMFSQKVYEPLLQAIPNARYVIDVGANIGLATRFLGGHYPGAEVFSVEPDPDNFALLKRNVEPLMAAKRCQILRAAAWSSNGTVNLSDVPEHTEFDAVHVSENATLASRAVEALTIGEIVKRSDFPRIDILKVDIEGAESEIFKADLEWLNRTRAIAIEFHADSRKSSGFDELMKEHGFKITEYNHTIVAGRPADHV